MQGHIFDYKPGAYSGTDEYERTTTRLIEHCCSTMSESSSLRSCFTELKMKTITKPSMKYSAKDEDKKE